MTTVERTMHDAAKQWVSQGFKVFPVHTAIDGRCSCGKPDCADIGKHPRTEKGRNDCTATILGVRDYWNRWPNANIGVVTDGQIVVDVDPAHGGMDSLEAIEAKYGPLPDTLVQMTGGGGYHYIYRQPAGVDVRNTTGMAGYAGIDIRGNGGYIVASPSMHQCGQRYRVIEDRPIVEAPQWLVELTTKRLPAPLNTAGSEVIPEGQRNQTLASLAGTMRRRNMNCEEIEAALLVTNRTRCQPPIEEDKVRAIAKSVSRYAPGLTSNSGLNNTCVSISSSDVAQANLNRTNIGQTIGQIDTDGGHAGRPISTEAVKDWIIHTNGTWWDVGELDRDFGINTTALRDYRGKIMRRLAEIQFIEQHPRVNKQWRWVNTKLVMLDFKTATSAGVLPVRWPLRIEEKVNLFPGNMAVVAGVTNAGKTAFMFDFLHKNNDSALPVYYFCSEMGDVELRSRLEEFPGMDLSEWNFKAVQRARDFPDVVVPDSICVFDYLEITEELFRVNSILTAIGERIGNGLAVVAIQKKEGQKYGRGQEFSAEKSKLYVALDKGALTIVKGKSWAKKGLDPNGLRIRFAIESGCLLKPDGAWYRPGDDQKGGNV